MPGQLFNALNYLVPAAGSVRAYSLTQDFTTPLSVDWLNVSNDSGLFVPSGVFIDNTQGTSPITILVPQLGYSIVCPVGGQISRQYPAPTDQTVRVSGGGNVNCSVIFVDFPVIPFGSQEPGAYIPAGLDTDGNALPVGFDTYPQTLSYTGAVLDTIAVFDGVNTYTQTFLYTGANLTSISGWVKS